jgi:hypothetical protein
MLHRRNIIALIGLSMVAATGLSVAAMPASAHCDGVHDNDGDNIPVAGRECAGSTTAVATTVAPPTTTVAAGMTTSSSTVPAPRIVEIGTAVSVVPVPEVVKPVTVPLTVTSVPPEKAPLVVVLPATL